MNAIAKTTVATAMHTQREHDPVDVEARVGIGAAGDTEGKQWRRGESPEHGEEPTPAAMSSA